MLIAGDRVVAVGPAYALRGESNGRVVDLGNSILMPGLVNGHCHLDYTHFTGRLKVPRSFCNWIKDILALKAEQMYSDYALAWLQGARMLISRGTTSVGDAEAVPDLLPDVVLATPLRVCSFLEITGLQRRRTPAEIVRRAGERVRSLASSSCWAGLAPHAPYSTTPTLLRRVGETARRENWRLSMHVAESEEEFEMFMSASGKMASWLKELRGLSDCGKGSPVWHVHRQGLVRPNFIAVHVNYLAPGDAELLGRAGATVVHCPRSHAYFGHARFPYKALSKAGVNICLGTDSLASVEVQESQQPELDMFSEIREFARIHPDLEPEMLVRLATIHGARALGVEGKVGQISAGAFADLVVIPYSGNAQGAWNGVVEHQGPVEGVMINGRWAVPAPAVSSL